MVTVKVDNTIYLQYSGQLMMFDSYICSLILKKAEKYKMLARCHFQTKTWPISVESNS